MTASILATNILADGDDGLYKLIGTVVVLIIWGIGAMSSAAKKSREAAQRRQRQATPLPPVVAAIPRDIAPVRPARLPPLPALGKKFAPQRRVTAAPPPIPTRRVVSVPEPVVPVVIAARPMPAIAPKPPVVALSVLMNSDTIRSQFILAEVFQAPVALRRKRLL
jgi:hypothetical protein